MSRTTTISPRLLLRHPSWKKGFDILDNDHHVIHRSIDELGLASHELIAALTGAISGKEGEPRRAADKLAGQVSAFDKVLIRHLEDEEDLIIPLILERSRDDPGFRSTPFDQHAPGYCTRRPGDPAMRTNTPLTSERTAGQAGAKPADLSANAWTERAAGHSGERRGNFSRYPVNILIAYF